MENLNEDIDRILSERLGDASIDEEGTDWRAFKSRQKRRRMAFFWWSLAGALILLSGLFWLMPDAVRTENKEKPETKHLTEKVDVVGEKEMQPESQTGQPDFGISRDEAQEFTIPKKKPMLNVEEPRPDLIQGSTEGSQLDSLETLLPTVNKEEWLDWLLTGKSLNGFYNHEAPNFDAARIKINVLKPLRIPKKSNLFFEVQAGPSLNIPDFKVLSAGKAFIHKDYEGIRRRSEGQAIGFGLQMAVGKSFERLSYSLGVGFSNMAVTGDYSFQYSERPVLDVDGKIKSYIASDPSIVKFRAKQSLSFIEIPLNIQYVFIQRNKVSVGFQLGYVSQFLQKINGQLPNAVFLDKKENLSTENFQTRTSSLQAGLRFQFPMGRNSSIILMPEYRRGMGFDQIQSYYKTNFNYIGLHLNFRTAL